MVCQKSSQDVFLAILVLTICIFAFGSTLYGLFRFAFDLKDDQYVSRDHLILGGNLLQVLALAGGIFFLKDVSDGPVKLGIIMSMFVLMVIILYLTNYNANESQSVNQPAVWAGMILCVIDLYIKVVAIFMGFGVCSVDEVPKVLGGMSKTLMGGFKRR